MGWQLNQNRAEWISHRIRCVLDLACPDRGLLELVADGHPQPSLHPLAVTRESAPDAIHRGLAHLSDVIVRNNDLLVSYSPSASDDLSLRLRWRLLPVQQDMAGVELSLYAHTDLLHSVPSFVLRSRLDGKSWQSWQPLPQQSHGTELTRTAPHHSSSARHTVFGVDMDGVPLTYVQMLFPTEFASASLHVEGARHELRCQIFGPQLEKGVILVGQVRGYWLPTAHVRDLVPELYHAFCLGELPLTV